MALPDEEERKDEPSRDVSVREEIAEAFNHENDGRLTSLADLAT